MVFIFAPRASAIIYSLLIHLKNKHPWLLPANICPIVPLTFLKAKIPFDFIDIDPQTLQMNLEQTEILIKNKKVGGILYSHTYGNEFTPNEYFKHIKSIKPATIIVDDRCLCLPISDRNINADVVLYSTGNKKIVDFNSGGFALIKKSINYQPAHLIFDPKNLEQLEKGYKHAIETSSRYSYDDNNWLETDLKPPVWYDYSQRIKTALQYSLAHRESINKIYYNCLPKEIQLPAEYQTWRFNIRVKKQKEIMRAIFSNQLFASTHYASLAGIMAGERAQHSEELAGQVINLFNDSNFTEQQAQNICGIILKSLS